MKNGWKTTVRRSEYLNGDQEKILYVEADLTTWIDGIQRMACHEWMQENNTPKWMDTGKGYLQPTMDGIADIMMMIECSI